MRSGEVALNCPAIGKDPDRKCNLKVGFRVSGLKGLYWEPQTWNPKNIIGIKDPGRYIPIAFLLCSWGSLSGVPNSLRFGA